MPWINERVDDRYDEGYTDAACARFEARKAQIRP